MFVPTARAQEVCKPEQLDCIDNITPGTDASSSPNSDAEHDIGPVYTTPGIHRFIGVVSVATLSLLVCILWVGFGAWLRRKMRGLLGCRLISDSSTDEGEKEIGQEFGEPPATTELGARIRHNLTIQIR
jgi:hypothetical protein